MARLARLMAALVLCSAFALAETYNGALMDVMCKGMDPANHTKDCALKCAKSGFGLVLSDGRFLKFDEGGNAKAAAALKASDKEKDIKAKVTGTMDGELLKVESVVIQ